MDSGQLLIDTTTASSNHLHIGSHVPVTFAQTGTTTMTIGGIYTPNQLVGSYLTGSGFFLAHYNNPLPGAVLIKTRPAATGSERTLKRALAAYPNLTIQTRSQFENTQASRVNQLLDLIYVLLALAINLASVLESSSQRDGKRGRASPRDRRTTVAKPSPLARAPHLLAHAPRDLRSSYVTLRLYEGVPLTTIAREVGTSVLMIEQHYDGVIENWDGQRVPADQQIRAARSVSGRGMDVTTNREGTE
jgi:hypothetical protein